MKNPIAFVVILIIIQSCIKPSSNNPQPPLNPGNSNLTITALKPTNGYVPLTDTIIGTGFSTKINEDSVYYNGLKVTVLSATSTQLVVSLPSQTVTGQVLVKVNGSIAGGPTFTVFSVPSITAISPAHGVATMVDTIFGNNFSATLSQNSVFFNGVQANILAVSSNQLIVTIPQSTTGKVTVTSGGVNVTGPIFTYDNDSVVVSTLAGSNAQTEIDGPALSAAFTQVWDVSSDSLGNVYVADGGGNTIRKVSNGIVTTIAGGGSRPASWGQGTEFYQPTGVAVDPNSNKVYVSDTYLNRIRVISPSGTITTVAGGLDHSLIDGTGSSAYFYQPAGLVVDKNGNVFVADQLNNCIRKVTPAGVVTTFAGSQFEGFKDDVGTNAQFWLPRALTIDDNGNLYVADQGNNRIRKVSPTGVVTTIAGKPTGGYVDGQGTNAGLGFPCGITIDKKGNLYVTQFSTNLVRKITPSGWVSTIAGTREQGYNDGPGSQATFSSLGGITIDANGILYVADGKKVRKIVVTR